MIVRVRWMLILSLNLGMAELKWDVAWKYLADHHFTNLWGMAPLHHYQWSLLSTYWQASRRQSDSVYYWISSKSKKPEDPASRQQATCQIDKNGKRLRLWGLKKVGNVNVSGGGGETEMPQNKSQNDRINTFGLSMLTSWTRVRHQDRGSSGPWCVTSTTRWTCTCPPSPPSTSSASPLTGQIPS